MQVIFFKICFFSLKQPQRDLIRYKLLSINTQENPLQFWSNITPMCMGAELVHASEGHSALSYVQKANHLRSIL